MKKSTILMVIIVYIIAFFVVGILGMQVQSHFKVDYLNEITVSEFVLATEEPKMKLKNHKRVALNEEQEIKEEKKRYQNYYEFDTVVPFEEGMILKFNINLIPENSTYNDYKLWTTTATSFVAEKQADGKIFISNIQKSPGRTAKAQFTVEDLQNHKIITEVKIYIR